MNDKDFQALWSTALDSEDREKYIDENEKILVGVYGKTKRREYLGQVWDVAHMTIRDLIEKAGYNQSSFARRFCVPLRTVQNWCTDSGSAGRDCPPYIKLGFARQLNMI